MDKPPSTITTSESSRTSSGGSSSDSSSIPSDTSTTKLTRQRKHAWKYVNPTDENQTLVDAKGTTWYFCAKCVCKFTKTKGFYNKTHSTKDHKAKFSPSSASSSDSSSSSSSDYPSIDMAALAAKVAGGSDGAQGNLSSVEEGGSLSPDDSTSLDPTDDLEYTGVWCTEDVFLSPIYDDVTCNFVSITRVSDSSSSLEESSLYPLEENMHYDTAFDVTTECSLLEDQQEQPLQHTINGDALLEEPPFSVSEEPVFFDCLSLAEFSSPTEEVYFDCSSVESSSSPLDSTIPFDVFQFTDHELFINEDPQLLNDDLTDFYDALESADDPFYDAFQVFPTLDQPVTSASWAVSFATLLLTPLCMGWSSTSIFFFFISALLWDTLEYFVTPSPSRPQTSRRLHRLLIKRPNYLYSYPRRWVMLSCFMLLSSISHPFSTIIPSILGNHQRITSLSYMVDFSPGTFHQYNRIRFSGVYHLATLNCTCQQHDFSSCPSKPTTILPASTPSTDTLPPTGAPPPFDPFYFDDLDLPTYEINCDYDLSSSVQSDVELSVKAHNAVMGTTAFKPFDPDNGRFAVIFDSGASRAISGHKEDFCTPIKPLPTPLKLGGMANGLDIMGMGQVKWSFCTGTETIVIRTTCYYVPGTKARLISPQRLFNAKAGVTGLFTCSETEATLQLNDLPVLSICYDLHNHLPIGQGRNHSDVVLNLAINDDENQNLSIPRKLLLLWHCRFGHHDMRYVQSILRKEPFTSTKFMAASCADIPTCAICQYAKAHRSSTKGKTDQVDKTADGSVKGAYLKPGAGVSVDHFESRLKGRTYTSFGKTTSEQYKGGCIFVDHMSGMIHIEHQLGFSSTESIRAKQSFEAMCLQHGVVVEDYLADNGVFKSKDFVKHLFEHNQRVNYCGVNAHHQNGVAERNIQTVSEMARALLLHASAHWSQGIEPSLWPMAVDYAVYLFNHLPNDKGFSPIELFTGETMPKHHLKDLHVWGCPVYVLDPTLQAGKKLPRWEPRSRRGVFLGYSPVHSSNVPLILNIKTGSISPQYHVVFDDTFSSVTSITTDSDPPSFWNDLQLLDRVHRIPLDNDANMSLEPEWLSPDEQQRLQREHVCNEQVHNRVQHQELPSTTIDYPSDAVQSSNKDPPSITEATSSSNTEGSPKDELSPSSTPITDESSTSIIDDSSSSLPSSPATRPSRSNTQRDFYHSNPEYWLLPVLDNANNYQQEQLAYQVFQSADTLTNCVECSDTRAYLASTKKKDPDIPSFFEAMQSPESMEWIKAMKIEIKTLVEGRTWKRIDRSTVPKDANGVLYPVLKGTWAFKLK